MTADVIVVGAGPAGSVTALLLARAGVRVHVLDRAAFPRAKPCGDCLSAGTTTLLQRLGLLERVRLVPHATLDGWRIVAPAGAAFVATFCAVPNRDSAPWALAVERAHFDAALLDAAIAAGAHFEPRTRVFDLIREQGRVCGVVTSRGEFTASAVIGADGLRSIVARRLALVRRPPRLRKLSLTAHLDAPALASRIGEMHVGDGVVAGVAAVAAHGRVNLTVVADADRFGRAVAQQPHAFVAHAVATLPRLRGRVPAGALQRAQLLASGPFDRPMRAVVFDGGALVGDAAGYFDPFTGQGIHQALASAELLAPVLVQALARGTVHAAALAPYARQRRALLRGTRALQQLIEQVLQQPARAERAIRWLGRTPGAAQALIAVTGDIAPPARLLSPRLLFSLLAPGHPLEISS